MLKLGTALDLMCPLSSGKWIILKGRKFLLQENSEELKLLMLNLLFKLLVERLTVLSLPIATSHLSLVCLISAAKSDADEVGGSKLRSSSNGRPEANSQGKAAEVCVVHCNCVAYNFMLSSVHFAACGGLNTLLFYSVKYSISKEFSFSC